MSAQAEEKPVLDRMAAAGFEIRKSFTGTSKEAGQPASFSYEDPDTGSNFYAIDLGVKIGQIPWTDDWDFKSWSARLNPTLEIHRSTKQTDRIRKTAGGLNLAFERKLGGIGAGGAGGKSAAEDNDIVAMAFFDLKVERSRDSILKQSTQTATLRGGWYDTSGSWTPGADIMFGQSESVSLNWIFTTGIEDYRKLPIKEKMNGESVLVAESVDGRTGFFRVNVLLKPFRNAADAKLAITATETLRRRVSGDVAFVRESRLFEGSVDYYLDAENRFAIGFSYQRGRDPNRNFLDEEFSSLGLKLKL
jgi:hypothetical protein